VGGSGLGIGTTGSAEGILESTGSIGEDGFVAGIFILLEWFANKKIYTI
jgi:hypothetical protein